MVFGEVEPVESQFNLSYSALLNLHERLGRDIDRACEASFLAFCLKQEEAKRARSTPSPRAQRRAQRQPGQRKGRRRMSFAEGVLRGDTEEELEPVELPEPRKSRRKSGRLGKAEKPDGSAPKGGTTRYDHMLDQVGRRLELLRRLEYLEPPRTLLPRGRFAARVHGYDVLATEVIFDGALAEATAAEVVVLATSIVHQSRFERTAIAARRTRRRYGRLVRRAERAVAKIHRAEEELGITSRTKTLDWGLGLAVASWVEGSEFGAIRDLCEEADGDIVRCLRQAIQLLRMVAAPLVEFQPLLASRLLIAMQLTRRGLVDAETQLARSLDAGDAPIEGAGAASEEDLEGSEWESGEEWESEEDLED
jgi:hypothetical protein